MLDGDTPTAAPKPEDLVQIAADTVPEGAETATPELDPLFSTERHKEFMPAGDNFRIRDVVGVTDSARFAVVGERTDLEARHQQPVLVKTNPGDDEVIELPTDAADAGANSVALRDDGTLVAGGWYRRDGLRRPVVWAETGRVFEQVEVASKEVEGNIRSLADDGSAAAGYVIENDESVAVVWIVADDGTTWNQVSLPVPDGMTTASVRDLHRVSDDGVYIAVGAGMPDSGSALSLGFWLIEGGVASLQQPEGIASTADLWGITNNTDGQLIVAGGALAEDKTVPTIYRASIYDESQPGGVWTSQAPTIQSEIVNISGTRFGGIEGNGDHLVAWTQQSTTKQAVQSLDGGQSWEQMDILSNARGGRIIYGVGITGGVVLAGGNSQQYEWRNDEWRQATAPWATSYSRLLSKWWYNPSSDGVRVTGLVLDPRLTSQAQRLAIWSSEDGGDWRHETVFFGEDAETLTASSSWIFTTSSTYYDDPLRAWHKGDQGWTAVPHAPIDGAERSWPLAAVDVIGSDGESAIVISTDIGDGQSRAVSRRVNAGGNAEVGELDIEGLEGGFSVKCLVTLGEDYHTVIQSSASGATTALRSTDGLTWTEFAEADLGAGNMTDCQALDGQLVPITESDDDTEAATIDPATGERNQIDLPPGFDLHRFNKLDEQTFAVGSTDVDGIQHATLWWETPDEGWKQLPIESSGLQPDDLGRYTYAVAIAFLADEVIITGGDDTGLTVWRADRSEFFERTGLEDPGTVNVGPDS